MAVSDFDYVDPQKVLKNTAEFLARKPQNRAMKVVYKGGTHYVATPIVG